VQYNPVLSAVRPAIYFVLSVVLLTVLSSIHIPFCLLLPRFLTSPSSLSLITLPIPFSHPSPHHTKPHPNCQTKKR
jgi:hypothetical protein